TLAGSRCHSDRESTAGDARVPPGHAMRAKDLSHLVLDGASPHAPRVTRRYSPEQQRPRTRKCPLCRTCHPPIHESPVVLLKDVGVRRSTTALRRRGESEMPSTRLKSARTAPRQTRLMTRTAA